MKIYEGMFLVDSKEYRKNAASVEEQIKALVSKCNGELKEFEKWDDRKLAYEIKGTVNGTYYLSYFTGDPDTISKLNRECELSPLVIRAMFLRVKEIPEQRRFPEDLPDEGDGQTLAAVHVEQGVIDPVEAPGAFAGEEPEERVKSEETPLPAEPAGEQEPPLSAEETKPEAEG